MSKQANVTIALTRQQVEQIIQDMGWEDEDADAFWELGCREARDPGCLERENRRFFQTALEQSEGSPR